MKLRLAPDAIRLRLDPAELPALAVHGRLAETIALPGGGSLTYGVALAEPAAVRSGDGTLWIDMPRAEAAPLLDGSLEGVHLDLPRLGGALRVVVERDRGPKPRP